MAPVRGVHREGRAHREQCGHQRLEDEAELHRPARAVGEIRETLGKETDHVALMTLATAWVMSIHLHCDLVHRCAISQSIDSLDAG
jgi:hypothetical protein